MRPLQLTMASEALVVLGLALAKCSVLFLVRRIGSTRSLLCEMLLGMSVLWGLASVMAITIDCSPSQIIGESGFCTYQASRSSAESLSVADEQCSFSAGNSLLYLIR